MREYTAPSPPEVADDENLTDVIWANAERFGDNISFRRLVDGTWLDVTAKEFTAEVLAVAKGLMAAGISPGDRVGLLARTRYEWTLLDFAIWAAGGATVPIYETSASDQIHWILSDAGAKAVIVETDEHRLRLAEVRGELAELEHVWQIEAPAEGKPAVEALSDLGGDMADSELHARREAVRADDTATLVYTSGTTGRPKGVALTHRNLLAEVRACLRAMPQVLREGNSLLVFLPLAHVFARAISLMAVHGRVTLGHTPDPTTLLDDLAAFRPSSVVAVPRVFEKVYNSSKLKAHSAGKGKIFDAAERTAIAYSEALDAGSVPLPLRVKHALFDKLVYGKLRDALGGRCIGAVSGGAPLGGRLAHFFRGAGITVYEGYGLTETSAAACVNTERDIKIGTVGKPVAGTSVRIADDGEVLLAGDVVFSGYWKNEEATSQALEAGWFHTGDLGELDDEGFLKITGRKKEIIVTAGGKNVAPARLEDTVKATPLVSQAMVVGDQRPYVAALVTVDEEFFGTWKERNGKRPEATVAELADDPDLRATVQRAVDEANGHVSQAEAIRKFTVLPEDFTEAAGEITPSLKLKRDVVAAHYADAVERLYG
ncbi:long-chain acyl-CoA synthetase [Haloechinothrix alba]|uniref:Acyl-CoA synthetase n=1 Tax=Haloechinothrix alba TaxID=664784 RepID=A0A238VNN0_9PSEU|nr:long-chain fatty acid--CoA ligase [Haloechinothrix alba]SNR35757.1 long-chain acyl-CoA synthetase [Haloechinothrix alba]